MNIGDTFERFYSNELVAGHGITTAQAKTLLDAFGGLAVLLDGDQVEALLAIPVDDVMLLGSAAKAAQDARLAEEYDAG